MRKEKPLVPHKLLVSLVREHEPLWDSSLFPPHHTPMVDPLPQDSEQSVLV